MPVILRINKKLKKIAGFVVSGRVGEVLRLIDYFNIILFNGSEQDPADEEAAGEDAEAKQAFAELVQIQDR